MLKTRRRPTWWSSIQVGHYIRLWSNLLLNLNVDVSGRIDTVNASDYPMLVTAVDLEAEAVTLQYHTHGIERPVRVDNVPYGAIVRPCDRCPLTGWNYFSDHDFVFPKLTQEEWKIIQALRHSTI